jgi:hypothetical protein
MTVKWQSHTYADVRGAFEDYGYPIVNLALFAKTDMFCIWCDLDARRRAFIVNATPLLNCTGSDELQAAFPDLTIKGALVASQSSWILLAGSPDPPGTLICSSPTNRGE